MPKSSALSVIGLAREKTTPGQATVPAIYLPVTQVTPKDTVTQLVDKGMRGSMVDAYDAQAGVITGEFGFDGDVYLDSIGYVLAGYFGDVTESGTAPTVSHKFAVQNSFATQGQPVSTSFTDFYAAGTRVYAGGQYSELSFKFSADALLTYAAKCNTFGSATATTPTPAFTALEAVPGWLGVAKIGGTVVTEMTDAEITIKRTVSPIKPVDNTQVPLVNWCGVTSVEGKATLVMEDDTYLTQYLNGTKTSMEFSFGQGTSSLDFKMSKVSLVGAEVSRGKDYVEIPISFKAYGNSTDVGASAGYGLITATLINAIATGTY
jgi:hypothetical protein